MSEALYNGARQGLEKIVLLNQGDKVCIFTDEFTMKDTLNSFYEVACEITGETNVAQYVLEDYGERPLTEFPSGTKDDIKKADVTLYLAQALGLELDTVRYKFIDLATKNGASHGHSPGLTREVVEVGMNVDYDACFKLSKELYDFVSSVEKFRITSKAGTNLFIESNLPWDYTKPIPRGRWSNIPDGETLCFPKRVEGTMVIDGCVGDTMKRYGVITETPIIVKIKSSMAYSISCPGNKELEEEFSNYVLNLDGQHEYLTRRVGEFAFGTNIGLKDVGLIGNLLIDEKNPTQAHLAFGHPVEVNGECVYECKGHVDGLIMHPTVKCEKGFIMKSGEYADFIISKV
jgi:leucyl aminopeptidase (aminopeptidase T)